MKKCIPIIILLFLLACNNDRTVESNPFPERTAEPPPPPEKITFLSAPPHYRKMLFYPKDCKMTKGGIHCPESGYSELPPVPPPPPIPPPPSLPPQPLEIPGLIHISKVDEKPYWKSCEVIMDEEWRKKCSNTAIKEFIYENIKRPVIAREGGIEGMAVVRFVVEKDGSFSHYRILKEPGGGSGDAAIDVVKLFPPFEPAKVDGKPVKTELTLPVKFRLED